MRALKLVSIQPHPAYLSTFSKICV